jgi:uncharacterized protein DUF5684
MDIHDFGFGPGLAGGLLMAFVIVGAAVYIYMALALQTIARKTNTKNDWLAWIPIANMILLLEIARKPLWWLLLLVIPLVNVVISIVVWVGVAGREASPAGGAF